MIRRHAKRILNAGGMNAVDVVLHYETADPTASDADRSWLEEEAPAAGTASTRTVKAFVHFVTPESVVQRGFTELRAGDVIVDFAYDLDLSAYRNLKFEIGGRRYNEKDVGRDLRASWDVHAGGLPTFKTLLLTPAG